ncbi:hypothetical protein SCUCBS95973_002409 [Sporothrix curviconia]|uniref:DUF7924 domain-containing protein n=1 Tax=Sporothrix curviconia TaxID=1260050 RepID=A0ABP0B6J4_9PEZI
MVDGVIERTLTRGRVEDTIYRHTLSREGITLRPRNESPPATIRELIQKVGRRRSSPGPTDRDIVSDRDLEGLQGHFGSGLKKDVQKYFQGKIFPPINGRRPLALATRQHVLGHAIPQNSERLGGPGDMPGVSPPIPDLLYGYRFRSFTPLQQDFLVEKGCGLQATRSQQYLPFFLVHFKGEGGISRVSTNECMGGSACCVNITERLNRQVQACSSLPSAARTPSVDGATFSMAVHNNFARLFVTWQREDGIGYDVGRVREFAFHNTTNYIELRMYILNIIDWGCGERLQQVNAALDLLVAESRQEATAARKTREPPGVESGSSSSRKRLRR